MTQVQHWNGRSIIKQRPALLITSDASPYAWGATRHTTKTTPTALGLGRRSECSGPLTYSQTLLSQNQREALGLYNSLEDLLPQRSLSGPRDLITCRIRTDNSTLKAYVNHMGGRYEELNSIATHMWLLALKRGWSLQAEHIPGVLNYEADALSRPTTGSSSWRLSAPAFRQISATCGPFSVDAFAESSNSQLSRYWSMLPDPQAAGTDALEQDWQGEHLYAFPPPRFIAATIKKSQQEGCKVTLVTPEWPTQPWWPLLRLHARRQMTLTAATPLLTGLRSASSGAFSTLVVWSLSAEQRRREE
jgi:hypothetical protein